LYRKVTERNVPRGTYAEQLFQVEQWALNMKTNFDIIVIGAGHAGVEAAYISSQFKSLEIGLVILKDVSMASTPCNPSIGGVGKGQVVREIDAMGGMMGLVSDLSGTQYRTLNDSKGYAVRSTRVLVDKDKYSQNAEEIIRKITNIKIIRGEASQIIKKDDNFCIEIEGNKFTSSKVIVTAGTFLSGKTHIGKEQKVGGRYNKSSTVSLSSMVQKIKTNKNKFKTGTPPRIKQSTVNFDNLVKQGSDIDTSNFHWRNISANRVLPQVDCYLTRTNQKTIDIISENQEYSPIFNGQIQAVGPRYCPSVEDKVFRYPHKSEHHVFLEPEGHNLDTLYPSGISTSLPRSVQDSFVSTINGLEEAKIENYGYAVEYDVVDSSMLSLTLEYQDILGLFFAGQINGTSGYEEAAGQGLIAGINAACSILGKPRFILPSSISYIGVMIEDLVTSSRDEPYRLFTARSSNRLYIREDNAIVRLISYRNGLGLNSEIDYYQEKFEKEYNLLINLCKEFKYLPTVENIDYFSRMSYGGLKSVVSLNELIVRSSLDCVKTLQEECISFNLKFMKGVIEAVAISLKYEGYIARANNENSKISKLDSRKIDWEKIIDQNNISNECSQRIRSIRPETFSQLRKILGIRPATIAFVANSL
jgi:tRNA uridine 5-carboxymethylaminomethyl modification enzyme